MHNIEVPNSIALMMLGILATVALVYTVIAFRRSKDKKELVRYGGHLISGMVLGGGIGFGIAVISGLHLGEFWELGPMFGGSILGGLAASWIYARKLTK